MPGQDAGRTIVIQDRTDRAKRKRDCKFIRLI